MKKQVKYQLKHKKIGLCSICPNKAISKWYCNFHRIQHNVRNKVWIKYKEKNKQKRCKICNKINSEAHHKDYNKPYMIQWLCKKCHYQADKLRKTT